MNPVKFVRPHVLSIAMCAVVAVCAVAVGCGPPDQYDVVLRNGMIYDGSGGEPYVGDVAFSGDVIAALGNIGEATGRTEIDVSGLAVSPGFVNMMSWANESLIEDGHSQSDIRQGVKRWTPNLGQ